MNICFLKNLKEINIPFLKLLFYSDPRFSFFLNLFLLTCVKGLNFNVVVKTTVLCEFKGSHTVFQKSYFNTNFPNVQ